MADVWIVLEENLSGRSSADEPVTRVLFCTLHEQEARDWLAENAAECELEQSEQDCSVYWNTDVGDYFLTLHRGTL